MSYISHAARTLLLLLEVNALFAETSHYDTYRGAVKIFSFLESFHKCVNSPTHLRVFVGFGKTKSEIRVIKDDFRGDLVFF